MEVKLELMYAMHDARSAINLMLTGPEFYKTARGPRDLNNIARHVASNILQDQHPDGIKLAFMVFAVRSINHESRNEIETFLKTYMSREKWAPELYNFRAVIEMPSFHDPTCKFLEWVKESKCHGTNTLVPDLASQRRACYIIDVYFTLFQALPKPFPLDPLLARFWGAFSEEKIDTCSNLYGIMGLGRFDEEFGM